MRGGKHKSTKGFLSLPTVVVISTLVLALGAGAVVLATSRPGKSNVAGAATTGNKSSHKRRGHSASTTTTTVPIATGPLSVASISPAANAQSVGWNAPVTVQYNEALSTSTPLPTLSPALPGSWDRVSDTTLEFRPTGQYVPYQKETLTVPANSESSGGSTLGHAVSSSFTVKGAPVLRLQELLAELGYLPVSFTPSSGASPSSTAQALTTPPAGVTPTPPAPSITGTTLLTAPGPGPTHDFEPSNPADVPLQPLPGQFTWRFSNIPATLSNLWTPGQYNTITKGAVMAFENNHGMADDGVAGPLVWGALLKAVAAHQYDTSPYDYVYVTQNQPEYVTVWRDGVNVFTTLANTGIPQSPTQVGTWPVYLRYQVTTMSGVNPNGTPYNDPGIPWVSYFNGGDALHGFLRAQYGFPQSLGCVEMPFSSAGTVWPMTPIGTLVTVL